MTRLMVIKKEISGCHECFFKEKQEIQKGILSCFCNHPELKNKESFTIYSEVVKKVFHFNCPLPVI